MNPSTQIQDRSASANSLSAIAVESRWMIADTAVMTWRNLIRYRRSPELFIFSTASPVMFIFLFNYVFGGAIPTGDLNYIDFLMPGILVQTTLFSATQTGVGLAEDLQKGMVDRYRSLPMARSAVLGGRVAAETLVSLFVACLMLAVGYIIGMRFHGGFWPGFAVPFMVAGFAFGFSWVAALIGASVRNAEGAGSLMFFVVFPFTFLSSAFVPVETMPGWLQPFTSVNPVTYAVDLGRALSQGGAILANAWPTLLWTLVSSPSSSDQWQFGAIGGFRRRFAASFG